MIRSFRPLSTGPCPYGPKGDRAEDTMLEGEATLALD